MAALPATAAAEPVQDQHHQQQQMSAAELLGTTAAALPPAAAATEDETFSGIFDGLWRIQQESAEVSCHVQRSTMVCT